VVLPDFGGVFLSAVQFCCHVHVEIAAVTPDAKAIPLNDIEVISAGDEGTSAPAWAR